MCMFLGVCSLQRCSRLECEARAEHGCVRGVGGDKEEEEEEEEKKKVFVHGVLVQSKAMVALDGIMFVWSRRL